MDIFLEPSDPAPGLQQQTPYLCIETWDGGLYRTYAHRKGRTSLIPQLLRQVPHLPLIEQPYLENLYPTPKEELQPFLQTWLYFGTIAEMLALNEISPGVRLIDEQAAKAEIDALRCKLIRQDENGKSIISAKEVLEWSLLFRERLALASDKTQRMTYLSDCLQYACILIHSFADNVEHTVRYSIAALGELFSTGLHAVASLAQPRILLPITGFSWYRDYIKPGGEFNQLLGFSPKAGPENTLTWPRPEITTVQRTLHFRTVSVPADEPLCISTLLNLDTKYIAQGQDANHRMIRMWELLAREKGGIPARLVFYLDEPIDVPGWRWAPRSLLASAVDDPVLGLDERVMRFHVDPADPNTFPLGVPTLLGLKVNLPGYRIAPTPILPGMPLHPWPDVINPTEDQVLVREETTGRWFRIMDWYRSKKLPFWTRKQRLAYDARENNPLCRAIDTGNCAILLDNELARDHSAHICCLVQVESAAPDDVAGHRPLKVRRERSAIMAALTATENKLMDFVKGLAESVARDASTDEFLQVQRAHRPGSEEWDAAEEKVRDVMKEVMREAWYAHEELQKAVKDTMGEDIDDYIWVMIPKAFSHGVGLREAEGRWWIVD
ncbi:hypothetical protein UVI_02035690 [Ustilaginoidea virens]|uniref:HET domain protein n=1 Tax=Ustilaginoidea virens TaxID=1159556 RepID=A0A1B5KSW6_USTVR|nr:hypothetical protein UVI_02035690 [Ustilaginoidea virens]